MKSYRYTECGLDHVIISGADIVHNENGEETCAIKNVLGLHKAIAHAIVSRPRRRMTGREFRFLRSEMGFTREEAGKRLGCDRATIGQWERDEEPAIDPAVEVLMKLLAVEKLGLDQHELTVEELAPHSDWDSGVADIRIDGRNPDLYRLAA